MTSVNKLEAVDRVVVFVRNNLDKGVWKPGDRLPSSRRFARQIGVSKSTVIRAIAILKSEARINGVARGSVRAGVHQAVLPDTSVDSALWRLKRSALEKDILNGSYALRSLPSLKELQKQYGACFRTMRKILRSMAEDGIVQLHGKRYKLQSRTTNRFQERIVFITYRVQGHPWSALNMGEYRILDFLEHECIRQGLRLDVVEINFFNTAESRSRSSSPAIHNPALGYVLDLWWAESPDYRRSIADLLGRLAQLKRPVSILDEQGEFELPSPFSANALFQVLRIEGRRAGARVARHLLDLGHRSVAFLSPFHNYGYSQQRLAGVVEQFSQAGIGAQVPIVMNDAMEGFLLQILAISGYTKTTVQKVIAVNRTPREAADLYESFCRLEKGVIAQRFKPADVSTLKENLAGLALLAKRNVAGAYFDKMCSAALTAAEYQLFDMSVEPLFEKALVLSDVTAWICVTDGLAITAMKYLQKRGIGIPRNLSIVGFDNLPVNALENRLTSFDFNVSGFIHHMLAFITRPPKPRGTYRHSVIEIEGTVMQRDTTAAR